MRIFLGQLSKGSPETVPDGEDIVVIPLTSAETQPAIPSQPSRPKQPENKRVTMRNTAAVVLGHVMKISGPDPFESFGITADTDSRGKMKVVNQ